MIKVGVCGTDKEICAFEYGAPPDGSDYPSSATNRLVKSAKSAQSLARQSRRSRRADGAATVST